MTLRIASGVTDQYLYFVAVDLTDYATRETGLSSFTVYRSRNGAAAAPMTTPAINEVDATNMPGVYELLLDEDMTIGSGNDTEAMTFHITQASMAPVTVQIELYRPKITAGETLTVSSGVGSANALQISGDSTAADNLEAMYDGSGYTNDLAPATQRQVGNLASGSAAISTVASSYTLTTGTQSSGTISDAETKDGTRHEHTDTAGAMDLYYEFDVGGNGVGVEIDIFGYLSGANDSLTIQAYDWVAAGWDTIGTMSGTNGSTDAEIKDSILLRHTGTGANLGLVRIRFYAASGLTSATLRIDRIILEYAVVSKSVGYDGGQVWIDTTASNTNTESFVDGVADNPVSTLAAANTVAGNVGLHQFYVEPGSSITFAASQTNEVFNGKQWTLALGGQDVGGSRIVGASSGVSGTCTGTNPFFYECSIGAVTVPPCAMQTCGFSSTVTLGSAGDFFFIDCFSQVAGASSPTLDMGGAVGATNVSIRRWSGGLTINNLAAGDVVSLDGTFGTITLNGADAQVEIRGIAKAVVNNLTGSPTVNDDSVKADSVEAILVDTGTTIPSLISTAQADLDTITGADGATLATTQNAITWGAVTISVTGATDNITLAGSGTGDALAFTRSGSGTLMDTAWQTDVETTINGQVLDVMNTDTFAELTSIPAASATLTQMIRLLYSAYRNKTTQTSTTYTLRNDADSGNIGTSTVSDDGTTFTKGEIS